MPLSPKKLFKRVKKKGFKALTFAEFHGQEDARRKGREEREAIAEDKPVTPPVVEMPTMNMEEIQNYRKQELLKAQARGGRRSTILSDKTY